ncbi:MAG: IclR family transcriptional regulator [Desulfobacula sp.]|uniref:IclR family transcriptional regulator n=1 Tax=Desulfobacula sp. TaxID=2593537 RepID=UPI0025C5E669|nr:IclR family transcriptional regulator [Desulfobacula sp.]MCD4721965.1 IclR family transcriptional regulator [Desulfobacula sp.]
MTTEKKKSIYHPASPAVEQAAQLLLCLGKSKDDDMGLTTICKEIGIHKSKGFSILNSLMRYDLITKDSKTKTYSLGPALMPLARKAREKLDINAIAKDHLQKLADKTKTSVLLGIICNDQFYIAGKYDGNDKLSVTVRQYQSLHITHGSHGKAIFAFLNEKEQKKIINSDQLFFHGDIESLDKKRLQQELKFCRENGYAVDNGEVTPGIKAVSAPVFDHNNEVTAGIVLVGTFTEDKFKTFGKMIAATARTISKQAGAQLS